MTSTLADFMEIPGRLSVSECDMLAVSCWGARRVLEVGHWLGRSTAVILGVLEPDAVLVTVDHHAGDYWTELSDPWLFLQNVAPFDRGQLHFVNEKMELALPALTMARDGLTFDVVFYDADHHEDSVRAFWRLVRPLLAPSCKLVYDDADWDDQSVLGRLAAMDGFSSIRTRDFWRGPEDKDDPGTFTLEVMVRG